MSSPQNFSATPQSAATSLVRPAPTLGWAIRRAVLGIVIMTVTVAGAACLLYFTIDPDTEARAEGDASRAKPAVTATVRR